MGARQTLASLVPSLVVVVAALVLLQVALPFFKVPGFIIPLPSSVLSQFITFKIPWAVNVGATFTEIVIGFILAVVGGICLGTGIALSRVLKGIIQPLILAAQVIPKVAFAPILFLWFGLNILPRILTVFLVCFFPIVIDTAAGLGAADQDMVDLVRSFDTSRLVLLRKVQFPNALPEIFAGLKVAATLSVVGAVVSEFIAANHGLGFLIASAQVSLDTSLMFAAASLLILLGFLVYGSVALAERFLVPWRKEDDE